MLFPLLNGSLKIACGLQDDTSPTKGKKVTPGIQVTNHENNRVNFDECHLLQDDLAVLAGGLAGAGAIVVPLGQLAGIGDRAGESLHQPIRTVYMQLVEQYMQLAKKDLASSDISRAAAQRKGDKTRHGILAVPLNLYW
jgi:hypothetical protein